jgi:hypothetical protein
MKTTVSVVALLALVFALSGCGAGKVTVPNVEGKDPQTAYDHLHKAGLKVSMNGGFSYYSIGSYSKVVQSQQPLAGEIVSRGTNVSTSLGAVSTLRENLGGLWSGPSLSGAVSSGSTCSASLKRVPNLTGKPLAEVVSYWSKCSPDFVISYLAPLTGASGKDLTDNYVVMYQGPAGGAPMPDCWINVIGGFGSTGASCQIKFAVATPSRLSELLQHKAKRHQAAIALVFKTDGQPWSGQPFPTGEAAHDCSIPTGRASAGLSVKGRCGSSARILADHSIQVKLRETWPSTSFYVQTCTNKTGGSCYVPPAFSYPGSTVVHDGGEWIFSNSLFVKVCGDHAGSSRSCGPPAPSSKWLSYTYTYSVTRAGQIEDPPGWGDFPPQFVH